MLLQNYNLDVEWIANMAGEAPALYRDRINPDCLGCPNLAKRIAQLDEGDGLAERAHGATVVVRDELPRSLRKEHFDELSDLGYALEALNELGDDHRLGQTELVNGTQRCLGLVALSELPVSLASCELLT